MRGTRVTTALAIGALAGLPAAAHAQKIREPAALKKQAKITADSAQKIALAQSPNGTIQSGVLEREKGKLVYLFHVKTPGRTALERVRVDAMTGTVVAAATTATKPAATKPMKKP